MKSVTIYTGPLCAFCDAAKKLLTRNNVEYKEINIATVDGAMDEMIKKANGKRTIPQIFFDNWAASETHTSSDLTSVFLAAGKFTLMAADIGWKEVYAKIDSGEISYNLENAKINPRFLHFFVDESRMSLPWWMELSTWHEFHSLVEGFDKLTGYWGEFADPKILLSLFETALMPENFSDDDSEDRSYFENAIDFLREVVEQ